MSSGIWGHTSALPRVKRVTSWPSETSWRARYRPMKRVPPIMRIFLGTAAATTACRRARAGAALTCRSYNQVDVIMAESDGADEGRCGGSCIRWAHVDSRLQLQQSSFRIDAARNLVLVC